MTDNVTWHHGHISRKDKSKLLSYKNKVLWFTGLSGSGKSTIARLLEKYFHDKGKLSFVLDGDNIRHGLNSDLGFSKEDREDNIRRLGEVTKLFYDSGIYTIVCFISPYKKDRDKIRNLIGEDFIEVFVDCSIEECEKRDPKGLYRKARAGEIKEFTGISSPYEEPLHPEIYLNTHEMSAEECLRKITDHLIEEKDVISGENKTEHDFTKYLEKAKELALLAGDRILEIYDSDDFSIKLKSDDSPLTRADLDSEQIIIKGLKKIFPEHAILSEESEDDSQRLKNELVWVVDPLDGTKEFISRNGEFTVNIGLSYKGKPVLGVIHVPAKRELYYALQGKGSFLEKESSRKELRVSDKDDIKDMILVRSRSHASEKLLKVIEENDFSDTISSGSSVKGCLVAEGKADVYYRLGNTREWDICAMDAIVREAGGRMTDLDGNKLAYNKEDTLVRGFLASNKKMHEKLLSLLN